MEFYALLKAVLELKLSDSSKSCRIWKNKRDIILLSHYIKNLIKYVICLWRYGHFVHIGFEQNAKFSADSWQSGQVNKAPTHYYKV